MITKGELFYRVLGNKRYKLNGNFLVYINPVMLGGNYAKNNNFGITLTVIDLAQERYAKPTNPFRKSRETILRLH